MKIETTAMLSPGESATIPDAAATGWRTALPALVLAIVAILAIYWQTAESIEAIWSRSETFAHGYLIVPISLWLIWTQRKELARLTPSPDYLGLLLLAGLGFAWLAAAAGQVQVVQQYAMVAMIPTVVIVIAGRRVARALAFPLGFLLLGVPVGEALIPPLMDWTADFTVTALRLSGIPVYREGTFFTIPSGQWSVVEGCSGLRYLIASITVGALFAYLSYQKLWKRLLFVALSVIVPIIANGMRAYMIVMIAHLSDMKLALGIDHLIYGWLFFGLVMLLLFWSGSFWRDPEPGSSAQSATLSPGPVRAPRGAIAGAAVAVVVLAGAWPLYAAHLDRSAESVAAPRLPTPAPSSRLVDRIHGRDGLAAQVRRSFGERLPDLSQGRSRGHVVYRLLPAAAPGGRARDLDERHGRAEASDLGERRRVAPEGRPRKGIADPSGDAASCDRAALADMGFLQHFRV